MIENGLSTIRMSRRRRCRTCSSCYYHCYHSSIVFLTLIICFCDFQFLHPTNIASSSRVGRNCATSTAVVSTARRRRRLTIFSNNSNDTNNRFNNSSSRNGQSKEIISRPNGKNIIIPINILRNLLLVKPSLASIQFGITCGLGYFLLNPYPVIAKEGVNQKPPTSSSSSERLPFHVVAGRAITFWKKVAPIIIHYKFATMWMKRIKEYDRPRRDEIYDSLHSRYAPDAKEVCLELKGEFVKRSFPLYKER